LPEAQQAIAKHFVAATDSYIQRNLSSLLARYADSNAAAIILAALDTDLKKQDCIAQINVTGWLLKTRAPRAPALLNRVFEGCGEIVFAQIGNIVDKNESVERLAIRELDNSNLLIVIQALYYIRDHGSAISEQPVWDRLMQWNNQWGDRITELKPVGLLSDPHLWDRVLGMELPRVLAHARGWLADEAKLHRILDVTHEENGRRDVEVCLTQLNQSPVQISYSGWSPGPFTIGCYQLTSVQALKDKLLQFPPGTSFVWNDTRSPYFDSLDDTAGRQVAEWAAAHNRRITLVPSPWLKRKDL
jgi:hypothetical protein